jgi:hypothetical protein
MPQKNSMYYFQYIDGEMYEVDLLGHINGKFSIWIGNEPSQSQQRLALTESNLEELRKFSVRWEKIL